MSDHPQTNAPRSSDAAVSETPSSTETQGIAEAPTGATDSPAAASAATQQAATEAESAEQTDWQAVVAEKDELIAALTERLEEAAEQLDRLKRTVGEHGLLVAGLPKPVIEQQQRLTSLLSDILDAWTDPEHSPWEEITRRLDRLDAAIREGFDAQADLIGSLRSVAEQSRHAAASDERRRQPSGPAPSQDDPENAPASVGSAAASAPLLPGGQPEQGVASAEPAVPPEGTEHTSTEEAIGAAFDHVADLLDAATGESVQRDEAGGFDITQLSLPTPIADDETDVEALRAAVAERDRCIVSLLRSLRQTLHPDRVVSWRQILSGQSDDAALARIEELEHQLQQALRTAEIELSLERAQVAREKALLEREREQLRRTQSQRNQDKDTPRWLRFLAGSKRS